MQEEHSAILSTFIKLPFSIKTCVLSILSGGLRQFSLYESHVQNVFHAMVGKNCLKIFVFETNGPITIGLDLSHEGYWPYKVCSNEDPRMILTLSNLVPRWFTFL